MDVLLFASIFSKPFPDFFGFSEPFQKLFKTHEIQFTYGFFCAIPITELNLPPRSSGEENKKRKVIFLASKTTLPQKTRKKYNNPDLHRSRLPCPICEFPRLIDTNPFTISITYIPIEDGYWSADYYQKCKRCREEIGIRKI